MNELSDYTTVGRNIGRIIRNQSSTDENLSADEQEGLLTVNPSEEIVLDNSVTITKYNYGETSFILDHPVYGELDSNTLELDGGYADDFIAYTNGSFTYPGTYSGSSEIITVLTF